MENPQIERFSDAPGFRPYDKRRLSYANTFTSPWKSNTIRVMEWLTGKVTLLRLIRKFEASEKVTGQAFFTKALATMGIGLNTPESQIANIPATGPVIVVANHPHGLVDGMILADLIGRVRTDYKILTRSLLTGIEEIAEFMIPVPFQHEENALQQSLEMRKQAMDHLAAGGVVVLFPSGAVANAETWFGPAIEKEWHPFTAKMILKSGAAVVPVYFPGQNSRAYQIAAQISPTLRQGLLLHEVVHALNRPQAPVVGAPLAPEVIADWATDPRGFMEWLREQTLSLRAD
ncbi:acyltransferase [Aliigemmobacter aestuarii]|uniref:Acyltransferase n=1 Tax=Aliigemmobacter aestuarii TaxID=1445661 RepID=A0A4S3MUQ1_9RHOB|nr:lysophospholipid acyltransferase family protein [Gemmobacter aestuarii]THD85271.1 acyltransferase [Gemmobacter aestuarii]